MKNEKRRLIDNNNFLRIFSLAMAALIWYIVVTTDGQNVTVKIKDVPVRFDEITSSSLGKIGLNPINIKDNMKVDVLVSGKREEVGAIDKNDVLVFPDISKVRAAGVYDVDLICENPQSTGIKIESVSPKQISIQFDKISSKKMVIEPDVSGLSVPEGYMINPAIATPREVTISGPEADISRIYKVIAKVEVNKTIDSSFTKKTKLLFVDRDMNVVNSKYISSNYNEATVSVPVLEVKKVPFKVNFTNVPEDFPIEDLEYEFSSDNVTIAVPSNQAESFNEIKLGNIDLRTLKDKSAYKFDVTLPEGYINISGIDSVIASVDTKDMKSVSFVIKNIDTVKVPAIYDVNVETESIEVEMFGKSEAIDNLLPSDIEAVIDFSERKIGVGKTLVPVKIFVPSGDFVFAVKSYKAVVDVKEK